MGNTCVGHEEIGRMLADKLNYEFIDQNNIIKKQFVTIDKYNAKFPNDMIDLKLKKVLL